MVDLSRRSLLKHSLVAGMINLPALSAAEAAQKAAAVPADVLPYTSNTGRPLPPKGATEMNFSFDFPEPSVPFANLFISARVHTYENTYAMNMHRIRVHRSGSNLRLECDELTWAGEQEKAAGRVTIWADDEDGVVSLRASAAVNGKEIKSVSIVVRGIPRGEVSRAGQNFSDPKDDDVLASWPNLDGGTPSPIVVLRSNGRYTSVAMEARPDEVRIARFFMQPLESTYRTELIYEREAWTKSDHLETPLWKIRHGDSYNAVAAPHYRHVEKAFGVKTWEERTDVPQWTRHVSLVVALHGAHWTGYIMNDYARQLQILKWVKERIDPAKVMVFLPAWDGRYYWNYPEYEVDPRMGGEAGLRRLIDEGHRMGFHFVAMFGSNLVNRDQPAFQRIQNAVTIKPDYEPWVAAYVDWDNDRRGDANFRFMNLGVASWRNYLAERIERTTKQYNMDGYFLDVVGCSENNRQDDMFLGTRALVEDLKKRCPGVLAVGEMHYDALMGCIPVFQADNTPEYPAAYYRYGRMFEHLSWPAPGRGSTGVHEFGFTRRGKVPKPDQRIIPTLTVVDDTFDKYRPHMEEVIAVAKQWSFPGLTAAGTLMQSGSD